MERYYLDNMLTTQGERIMLKRVQILLSCVLLIFAFSAQADTVKAYKQNKAQKKANKVCANKGHQYAGANAVRQIKKGRRGKRSVWEFSCKKANTAAANSSSASCSYGAVRGDVWSIKATNEQKAQRKANNRCRRANKSSAETVHCYGSACSKGALKRKNYCYKCVGNGGGSTSGSGSTYAGLGQSTSGGSSVAKSCKSGEHKIKARKKKRAEKKAKKKCKKAKKAYSSVYSIGGKNYCGVCKEAAAEKKCKSGEISFKSGKKSANKEATRKCRKKQKKGLSSVYNIGGRNYCAVCDGGTTYKSGDPAKLCTSKGFFGGVYKKANKERRVTKIANKTCQKANLNGAQKPQKFSSIKNRKKQVLWCYKCNGTDEGGGDNHSAGDSGKVNVKEATKVCSAKGFDGGAVARRIKGAQKEANRVCQKFGKVSSKDEKCVRNCNKRAKKKIFCFTCTEQTKKYASAKCSGRYSLKQSGGRWICKHKKKNKTKVPKCKRRYSFDDKAKSAGQTCFM